MKYASPIPFCFFCNSSENSKYYFECENCKSINNLDCVISKFDQQKVPFLIEICLTINNASYDVCIYNDEMPRTIVYKRNSIVAICDIEGSPFTPSNVKEKLHTYLLLI